MRKTRIHSFLPIAAKDARILVLGSLPGAESLRRKQYYAHPQNQFWKIMEALFGIGRTSPYRARVRALKARRIAVWDVLHSCEREGSLDASIEAEIANDFERFFRAHPRLRHVFFNGAKAEASFRRHVRPRLGQALRDRVVRFTRLPSTSPAHAALPFARKLAAWRAILKA
ncbi:MAG: DNA-deoxyinosine glycosylase [Burkholderiales bacterium]